MSLRRLVLVAAVLALTAPGAASATEFGLSDQTATSWADPRLQALGLGRARLTVPWDAATSQPDRVQAWLSAVATARMTPHVAFEHLSTDRCPSAPCTVPSRAAYGAAVRRFMARFPQVRTYTTWNEANHQSQPVASRPEAVAGYYEELKAACAACTIVAGDVLDDGGYVAWLRRFRAATTSNPQRWGLHNYGDVTYGRTTGVDAVLGAVPGELWVEETGGIVAIRNVAGRLTLSVDEQRAAAAVDRAFAIVRTRPRITRMYVYQWRALAEDRFDAGLLRPDGAERPSYAAVVRGLAAARIAAPAAPLRWTATWSRTARWTIVLRARCATADRRCRGTVTATTRTRRPAARAAQLHRVAVRRYATTRTAATATIRVRVTAAVRARLRRAATRALVLTVRATLPRAAARRVVLTLPRPR